MKNSPNIIKWKFKKLHKPNYRFRYLLERKLCLPMSAEYAIQAVESGKITYKQLESCRRTLRRGLGKSAGIVFYIFMSTPLSKKPIASRMGKVKAPLRIE